MRRKSFVVLLIILVLAALGVGCKSTQGVGGSESDDAQFSVRVFIASDLHFLSPELTDNGEYFMRMIEAADGKAMEYSLEIADALVERVIEKKPDYLIMPGDITFNGEKASHISLSEKLREIEDAGVEVMVIPGNHDLYSDTAASFSGDSYTLVDSVKAKEFMDIYASFGYEEAMSRDESSLSYSYELAPGLWCIFVDVNTRDNKGYLTQKTYDWIQSELERAKSVGARIISVSHQNVIQHNEMFTFGYLMGGYMALEALYSEYDVPLNISGHMHIQHIAEGENGVTDIASSALCVAPFQYGVLGINDEKMVYRTEKLTFPHIEEATKFMFNRSLKSAVRNYLDASEEQHNLYATINDAYFAGTLDSIDWDDAKYKEMYEEFTKTSSRSSKYLMLMREEGNRSNTSWEHEF